MTAGEILLFILAGALFVVMALATSVLQRLPLTTSLLYLAAGYAVGPAGLGLLEPRPARVRRPAGADHRGGGDRLALHRRAQAAPAPAAPASGRARFRLAASHPTWRPALRLATLSMVLTVGPGGRRRLGALRAAPGRRPCCWGPILAPTDPVLASDVQVDDPTDRDRLRFSLTGEAGLNDGTAFPFVMLGLGLLGLHDLGPRGARWLAGRRAVGRPRRAGRRRAAGDGGGPPGALPAPASTGRRWGWTTSWPWG